MNQNEIKKLLEYYPYIHDDINKKQIEIAETIKNRNDVLDTLKAALITGMPHGTEVSDPVLKAIQIAMDIYSGEVIKILEEIDELYKKKKQVEEFLYKLTPIERRIIEARLLKRWREPWDAIARKEHYSWRGCMKIYDNLFKKII